jgi:hypothetical protein
MRIPVLLLIMAVTAHAQASAGKPVEQAFRGAFAGLAPIPQQDQTEIVNALAAVLAKHVTFRPDRTASAICTATGRQQVEWKDLAVKSIHKQAVNDADLLNGISKRYLAAFSCDAHRSWDAKTHAWGQWYPIGHVLFPSGITLEFKNGAWTMPESSQLKWFSPGPGAPVAAAQEPARQDPKSAGLPAGMMRAPDK